MFFKIIFLKMFANFIGNQLSLLITLQATRISTLLKRDSKKKFFCEICKIFKYHTPTQLDQKQKYLTPFVDFFANPMCESGEVIYK